MSSVMYFYSLGDENCRMCDQALHELLHEDNSYSRTPISKIMEKDAGSLGKVFRHDHVPAVFVDPQHSYVYQPGQSYDDIKQGLRTVLDMFRNIDIL